MGGSHPSSIQSFFTIVITNFGKEWGCYLTIVRRTSGFQSEGRAELCPVQGVPVLPSANISGGVSMGTSFLYAFIIQRTKDLYIKKTLQDCYKSFILLRCLCHIALFIVNGPDNKKIY
jgi:hypothetical protein